MIYLNGATVQGLPVKRGLLVLPNEHIADGGERSFPLIVKDQVVANWKYQPDFTSKFLREYRTILTLDELILSAIPDLEFPFILFVDLGDIEGQPYQQVSAYLEGEPPARDRRRVRAVGEVGFARVSTRNIEQIFYFGLVPPAAELQGEAEILAGSIPQAKEFLRNSKAQGYPLRPEAKGGRLPQAMAAALGLLVLGQSYNSYALQGEIEASNQRLPKLLALQQRQTVVQSYRQKLQTNAQEGISPASTFQMLGTSLPPQASIVEMAEERPGAGTGVKPKTLRLKIQHPEAQVLARWLNGLASRDIEVQGAAQIVSATDGISSLDTTLSLRK
ncbi:hypothetical protein [Anthocerotibacter panamensis]|uniref:hypothetical protein n=1 Tax=Anthocerotibacter panamensis TaxID=2857077 RepID=UPI001C404BB1|nr:hypothetical protein [Anthocerotibacter panamensis]